MLDERDLDLGEGFADVNSRYRRGRTALAGQIAGGEFLVDFEVQPFLAVFDTEVRADARVGPGNLRPNWSPVMVTSAWAISR